MSTVKHYALNAHETNRQTPRRPASTERRRAKVDLLAFEIAIERGLRAR